MKKHRLLLLLFSAVLLTFVVKVHAQTGTSIITVSPNETNDCESIRKAIEQARVLNGSPSVIKFQPGTYHLRRPQTTPVKYYISNTMSWSSGTDNIKYIGIYLKKLKNVTIDGAGAKFITHGEITSLVTDSCENIIFKNFSLDAADPSVTEMTVESIENGQTIVFKAHETSNFEIKGNAITWKGEGWSFNGGPVQIYDPVQDITWRSWSPLSDIKSATALDSKRLRVVYNSNKDAVVGQTFQMRDGVRDQVAGFILQSKNVSFEGVKLHFLGNFGVVCQYSDSINFSKCSFAPDPETGRTNAGFADFLQVSGCKGLLKVEECVFQGAHDDPINVHGTYLKATNYLSENKVNVQFQHNESWGFDAFFVGDSIEFINSNTMLTVQSARITGVKRIDDRNIQLEFDNPVPLASFKNMSIVVENITWTPEVEIRKCNFSRVPTRGILLTTRRRSVIEENTFYMMQMAGIYVSGDAGSWYESGKVNDLTIKRNIFIQCGSPVIYFDPTNSQDGGQVHANVKIEGNSFFIKNGIAVGGKSVKNLSFTDNSIYTSRTDNPDSYCSLSQSSGVVSTGNVRVNIAEVSLEGAICTATSNLASSPAANAIDDNLETSWRPLGTDTERALVIKLASEANVNRVQLIPLNAAVLKYQISTSKDSTNWNEIIDYSDNGSSGASFSNVGDFGTGIRYIRINFLSTVNLAEVRLFGALLYSKETNLIAGTVLGTSGSWDNNAGATKEAVFDFDTESFFDAPTSTGWVGLDFGKERAFIVDSIVYAPRPNDEGRNRMVGGYFELSNVKSFSNAEKVFTVEQKPATGFQKVIINNPNSFRFARYVSPANGFCNISEIKFYGRIDPLSSIQATNNDASKVNLVYNTNSIALHFPSVWNKMKTISINTVEGFQPKIIQTDKNSFELSPYITHKNTTYLVTVSYENKKQTVKISPSH